MGYMHIENLYKNQEILIFKECFALEKLHGTSVHLSFNTDNLHFFSGGESHEKFVKLFDKEKLIEKFKEMNLTNITIYGEGYGGSQQAMSETYGKELKFCAFDVKIGDSWLSVPDADKLVTSLGLEFVHYERISTDLVEIDKQRDLPSVQAKRNGILEDKKREGVVLRPIIEVKKNNGERIICKHKGPDFSETKKERKVIDPKQLEVLSKAEEIAEEWVTFNRLTHVLQRFPENVNVESTGEIIKAMLEDVYREAEGEIVESKESTKAISKKTAKMFNEFLRNKLQENF